MSHEIRTTGSRTAEHQKLPAQGLTLAMGRLNVNEVRQNDDGLMEVMLPLFWASARDIPNARGTSRRNVRGGDDQAPPLQLAVKFQLQPTFEDASRALTLPVVD